MLKCLFVGLGGFVGAVCRYLVGTAFSALTLTFPLATLLINFVGAVIIGIITEFSSKIVPINSNLLLFLTVGVCGGFTTFSTFSLETVNLFEKGKISLGVMYVFASIILCLIGVFLGKSIIRAFAH